MSVIAGGLEGAEIGSLAGPVGAAVGAVVGVLVVAGLTLAVAHAVSNANQKADTDLKDTPQDQACAECGEVGCFNTPEGGDPDELERQLDEQQKAINDKSPDEILDRLKKFDEEGRPNDAADRAAAREQARQAAARAARKAARAQGKSPAEADAAANAAGDEAVAGKDATHELDWVAGGDGKISGMGDSKTNRSVGSQWNKKSPGSATTRRDDLKKAAEAAKKAGKKKMTVKLKKC